MTNRTFIIVALGLAACGHEVVVPHDGDENQGADEPTASSNGTGASGAAGGGTQPQNCWGCRELVSTNPVQDHKVPYACPGAYELALEVHECTCGHCKDACATCDPSVPPGGCAPCMIANCSEVGEACAADMRTYDPTKG